MAHNQETDRTLTTKVDTDYEREILGTEDLLLYYDGETISGYIQVDLKAAKFEHKVSFFLWELD